MKSRKSLGAKFGKHLKKVRLSKNMSLRELALEIESEKTILSRLENGHALPTFYTIARICDGLNITVSEFFEDFD